MNIIGRPTYLNRLISKMDNGMIKVITGTVAFDCIQKLIDNLDRCSDAVKFASPGVLTPVEELLNEMVWNRIRDQIRTEPGETPEEFVTRQIREIELSDNGEEEIVVHVRTA